MSKGKRRSKKPNGKHKGKSQFERSMNGRKWNPQGNETSARLRHSAPQGVKALPRRRVWVPKT